MLALQSCAGSFGGICPRPTAERCCKAVGKQLVLCTATQTTLLDSAVDRLKPPKTGVALEQTARCQLPGTPTTMWMLSLDAQ
eukprot:393422-Amphidinium_carterae.1